MAPTDKPTPDLRMMAQQIAHMNRVARASGLHRVGNLLDLAAIELERVRVGRAGKVVPLLVPGRKPHDAG